MSAEPLEIHIVADSTGESATRLARAAAAQFLGTEFIYVRHRRMASREKIEATLQELEHTRQGKPTVVLYTLVEPELVRLVTAACESLGFAHSDLMSPTLEAIEAASGLAADAVARRPVGVEAEYFQRMAAIDFAVRNDDGIAPGALREADMVLVGASRSGKTPLSMYLGYLGYRTANVPLVNGIPYPPELARVDRWRIVGLTIDPQRLAKLRDKRIQGMGSFSPQDGYADLARIYTELDEITAMQRKLGARILDTTNIALEESAARVIDIVETRARMAGTHLRRQSTNELTVTP